MEEYNQYPQNLQEISTKEFARSKFFDYKPIKVEFRQCYRTAEDRRYSSHLPLNLYWFDEHSGIAISHCFHSGTVTYYTFGCNHKSAHEIGISRCQALNIVHFGNCYHVFECPDCGETWSQDSSD